MSTEIPDNSICPQGVNFNTVYFEQQTYKIAAWIQTKMYSIKILLLSVFHPSLYKHILYMNLCYQTNPGTSMRLISLRGFLNKSAE